MADNAKLESLKEQIEREAREAELQLKDTKPPKGEKVGGPKADKKVKK